MPCSAIHKVLTGDALKLCGIGGAEKLITEYCLFPDDYFQKPETIGPYTFFTDGIQFHYLPDTPFNELYRYWKPGKSGLPERCVPFRNENFRHADAGFRFYLTHAVSEWRNGRTDEAFRYLGCLLHMLQDSTFGIHALEGPGGTDVFALNRLSGKDIISALCRLKFPESDPEFSGRPACLGNTAEETVPFLYARYVRSVRRSRQALFSLALELLEGTAEDKVSSGLIYEMRRSAVLLSADVLATARAIAEGTAEMPPEFPLAELEPFEFPLGGGGRFHFGSFEISGTDIAFGVHYSGRLLYRLPPGLKRFEADLRLDGGRVPVKVEFTGSERFELSPENPERHIAVEHPSGEFGVSMNASAPAGELTLCGAVFTRG